MSLVESTARSSAMAVEGAMLSVLGKGRYLPAVVGLQQCLTILGEKRMGAGLNNHYIRAATLKIPQHVVRLMCIIFKKG